MANARASVFDDTSIDVSDFVVRPPQEGAPREQVKAVAEPASFRSRESPPVPARREARRYRTGRNVQLNIKVRQEDANAFYDVADEKGWVLGEAFEMAVRALKEKG